MKTVAIVQARVGSTRLPGKVLMNLGGQTVLQRVIDRLHRCHRVDEVVVATTRRRDDDQIVRECRRCSVRVCRGSETDVLSRYVDSAISTAAETIVRVTSDCPLIDPDLIDQLIHFRAGSGIEDDAYDYVSNARPRSYPRGLDAEVMTFEALSVAHQNAHHAYEREHVTPHLYLNPETFRIGNLAQDVDQSSLRWTLDEPADKRFFERLFRHFEPDSLIQTRDVLELLARTPELAAINEHVSQKPLVTL